MNPVEEAADLLLQARINCEPLIKLPDLCCPKDIADAYEIQNALTEQMLKTFGGRLVGYKVACTNETAQVLVNEAEPFYGSLSSPFVYESPGKLSADKFSMRVIEPEFAFKMGKDLPARDKPYTKEEVSKAVSAILPSIEVVDSRFMDWTIIGAPSLIADNACNGAWIYGNRIKNGRT